MIIRTKKILRTILLSSILFYTGKIFGDSTETRIEFFIKPEVSNYATPTHNLYGLYSDSNFEIAKPYLFGGRFGISLVKNILIFNKISIYSGYYQGSREYNDSDRFGDPIDKKMNLMFFDLGLGTSFKIPNKPISVNVSGGILLGKHIFEHKDLSQSDYDYKNEGNGIGSVIDISLSIPLMNSFSFCSGVRYRMFKSKVEKFNDTFMSALQNEVQNDNYSSLIDMSRQSYNISFVYTLALKNSK